MSGSPLTARLAAAPWLPPGYLAAAVVSAALIVLACPAFPADDPPASDQPPSAGASFRLSTFAADVTVPEGHGMMGGAWLSRSVADPLEAIGVVLSGGADFPPVVLVAVDWCEIRNDAYSRWREALAAAAGTTPDRVLVASVHQHDAPVADLAAEKILRDNRCAGTVCDPDFHETAVQRVAAALRNSLDDAQPITHFGTGQARVERIASNRRYELPGGGIAFDRTSSTRNRFAAAAPEGTIDPWLKTLSFWNGAQPLAALSVYAVHPMSHYGQGEVSADFPGLARRIRQAETPGTRQIYFSGCSGNVTAGKFNDGSPQNRPVLAERLANAMREAWDATERRPLDTATFRSVPFRLEPRNDPGFTADELMAALAPDRKPFAQCLAAMGLSWRTRTEAGHLLDLPILDLGHAAFLVLPGEAYVEYQLAAQKMRPDGFVLVSGYGECATGYIPTDRHIAERDTNLHDWWWVAPGSEARLLSALQSALTPPTRRDR